MRLSGLLKIKQQVSDRAEIQTQVVNSPHSWPHLSLCHSHDVSRLPKAPGNPRSYGNATYFEKKEQTTTH